MDDNNKERKASDILLDLEEKINNIIKIISVYDMNNKIILDRANKTFNMVNSIYEYMNSIKSEENVLNQQQPQKEIISVVSENAIPESASPIVNKRSNRAEQAIPSAQDTQTKADRPSEAHAEKKVPVIQRICDGNGKDLFMAEVSIVDGENKVVNKTKTNAVGKWQAYLKPGNYSVNIVKTDTATKKKLEMSQNINVHNSDTAINLPVAIIKR